ncbi:hypothetical protein ACWCO9_39655, partial [Streptomyces sp. NPDC001937]
MRADRIFAYGATAGLIGDQLLGDPRRRHPVAAFGRAAAAVERRLWRDHRGWGALHTLVCAGGAAAGHRWGHDNRHQRGQAATRRFRRGASGAARVH